MPGPPVVAVINTSDDLVELLKTALEAVGFVVVVTHIRDIRAAQFDVDAFLKLHDPRVIVYDVAAPFDRNWRFMQHIRSSPGFAGRHFVITTMNVRAVEEMVKTDEKVYEVIGRESDIRDVVQAVKEATRARATR
jgi:CheY-like chemotaxis protein